MGKKVVYEIMACVCMHMWACVFPLITSEPSDQLSQNLG